MTLLDRLLGRDEDPEREGWVLGRRKFLFLGGLASGALATGLSLPKLSIPRQVSAAGLVTPTLAETVMVQQAAATAPMAFNMTPMALNQTAYYDLIGRAALHGISLHDELQKFTGPRGYKVS